MRQYALIHRAILDDPSWRCLTRSQQNLYLLLLLKLQLQAVKHGFHQLPAVGRTGKLPVGICAT